MAVYRYPGYETGQGWTLEPGNLEGGFWRDIRKYWGLRPQYWLIGLPRIPPQDSQVPVSTPGLFQALNNDTKPHESDWFFKAFQTILTTTPRTAKIGPRSSKHLAVYKYPGYETGQGWTLEPGNLKGGF